MSGSEAEERIRGKVEAALRATWPSARIIHELMLQQGGCRIDVAAVTADRLIVVEVKSERDVLDRLDRQIRQSKEVADAVFVVTAERHLAKARDVAGWGYCMAEDDIELPHPHGYHERRLLTSTTNAPARLAMLWASELRIVAEVPRRTPRGAAILKASDYFTGAEVRRRVCAALRARPFARADAPILCDLFPVVSKGTF